MRKVEQQVINALRNQKEFTSGNTSVLFVKALSHNDQVMKVLLHGNLIAEFNKALNELTIYDGGWTSVTTKSRLNALLSEFAPAYRVVQRQHCWYIDQLNEDKESLLPWEGHASFRAGSKL